MSVGNFSDFLNPFDTFTTGLDLADTWIPNNLDEFPIMTANESTCPKPKTPNDWSCIDIVCYLCNEATNQNRNYEDFKLQNFADVTSEQFREFSLDDCIRLSESSEDGEFFYKSKENLFKQYHYDGVTNQNGTQLHQDLLPTCPEEPLSRLSCSSNESSTFEPPARKGPGRPRSAHNVRRKPEKRMGKLWEFLRNLLLDSRTCPSLIKWDNFNEGAFKFVQSEKVAKLWGDRKKNNNMNYEKLSRAMRYYYRSKVLLPVAGKRLVYKFGPQATGWKTENPILDSHL